MAEIFLPTVHTFAMENTFTGSCGDFRFIVVPTVYKREDNKKEVDFEKSSMNAKFWHGLYCFEKSQMEGEKDFPITEEGRSALKAWLESNI